jgi:hypothetical protein
MNKYYNQYTTPKYTEDQLIDICNKFSSPKDFYKSTLFKTIKRRGLKDKCLKIVKENTQKNFKREFDKAINNSKSINEFRKKHPHFNWYLNCNLQKYKKKFIPQKFSSHQMMCKEILENILHEKCLYNCRKILKNRKELDIYFDTFKIACEYNGYYWHYNNKELDISKKVECEKLGIYLITIQEPSLNFYKNQQDTILDIKKQFKNHLNNINNITKLNIKEEDLNKIILDDETLSKNLFGEEDINYIINNCTDYSEIRKKYNKIWQYLTRNKILHLLEPVKRRDYRYMSKNTFINFVLQNCITYTDFQKHKCYSLAYKNKYTKDIKNAFNQLLKI